MKSPARLRILILLVLTVGALVSSLGAVLWGGQDWGGLALNFGTEMVGAIVTYLLLELVIGRETEKVDLVAQMGSTVKDVAIAAAEELRRYGWLRDGSLRGTDLSGANLWQADLSEADLSEADLSEADLSEADLSRAKLIRANLSRADLRQADLRQADLRKADLRKAILREAYLWAANLSEADLTEADLSEADLSRAKLIRANLNWADLRGANLEGANLESAFLYRASQVITKLPSLLTPKPQGASLGGAYFDENTTLPDGTKWTPETDMGRFTEPYHPNFWRPDA